MSSTNTLLSRLPSVPAMIAAIILCALAVLGVRSWLAARDANTKLNSTIATQKQLLDRAASREQQRDAVLSTTLAGIAQAKRAVQTPTQAAAQIPTVLPPLPAPIAFDVPSPPKDQPEAPPPPATASIPQADMKPLYDYLQDCAACQAQLTDAQGDLADERTKVTALTTERDAAVKASHGGGFWARVRQGAKWFAIGVGIGAVAASAASHR